MSKKYCFVLLFILFAGNFFLKKDRPSTEPDEFAWFYSSTYYSLAFEKKDFASQDWKGEDALDHPPLAKYIFGFIRSLQGIPPETFELKTEWLREADDLLGRRAFIEKNRERVPVSSLGGGRGVSSFFFFLASFFLYLITAQLFSARIGVFASLLFFLRMTTQEISVQYVADGIFIFFLMLTLFLQIKWAQSLEGKKNILYSILLGFCLGLFFLTKINGLAGLVLTLFLGVFFGLKRRSSLMMSLAVILGVFALVVFVLNPSFYDDPLGFMKAMFDYRRERLAAQQILFGLDSIPSFHLHLSELVSQVLVRDDPLYYHTAFPFFLFLFLFGIWRIKEGGIKNKTAAIVVGTQALFWIVFIAFFYQIAWTRYLIHITPFFSLVIALGLDELVSGFGRIFEKKSSLFIKVPAIVFSVALILILNSEASVLRYRARHPQWAMEGASQQIEYLMKTRPDRYLNGVYLHHLAVLYGKMGKADQADSARSEVLKFLGESRK